MSPSILLILKYEDTTQRRITFRSGIVFLLEICTTQNDTRETNNSSVRYSVFIIPSRRSPFRISHFRQDTALKTLQKYPSGCFTPEVPKDNSQVHYPETFSLDSRPIYREQDSHAQGHPTHKSMRRNSCSSYANPNSKFPV